MTTLQAVELGVLGTLQVRQGGTPVPIPGAKPRAILTLLGLHGGSVVSADTLLELLWGDDPPRTAAKALQTHISSLRRTLGDGFVLTEGVGWTLAGADVDALRYKAAARLGRDSAASGDTSQAVAHFEEALTLWRGTPELPDSQRGSSEKTRWIEAHAALVEDRADALLVTGRAAEIIGELEAAVTDAPLRERRWGQLMLALYRAGRQGEALGAYQRARSLLAVELGVDPGPELRRLEAAIVAQDGALEMPVAQQVSSVTRAVTFLLTDIEGSTAAWETDAGAMALALARHDELVEQVVTSRGGRLIKTRGEGDATFSVFDRPSSAAAAAIELQESIAHEPWTLDVPIRVRVALHTGEVELRDGDYFGRAVNRAARLRSLALGAQILCSGATAELVIDSLPDDVVLADLGMRQLRNLARPEHVFELRLETADDSPHDMPADEPVVRPELHPVLTGPGPFVGRGRELARLVTAWQAALGGRMGAVLIAGEPGVGKTRLAGEWSRQAYEQDAIVLYGRCDEDLGAPYQPFAEALRSLAPCLGEVRLRGLRGVEALLPLIPGLTDLLPDVSAPTRADPDTERYALFDAVVAMLELASTSAPVVLILDDLHWAAKSTLLLLRHLLRFGERARVQIVGTYRSTDLDRSHPLAAMLADLHRDGTAERLQLSGLDEEDVTAYVAEAGYDDEELARALASVTGGNPFFLIEALRHVDESGGVWDQSTLPQGVREAVSRRLSRLPVETNKALAAAAVVGSRFAVELVERVVDQDLVDAFDEACKAGIIVEEPGGHYRFNHALVRQSLLAELPSVRRMRLHQRIATTLENEPGADDELLADLAHHYFECAWAGNAAKAVEYCSRAADQAMARLAYEGAADLYDHALHALEEIDEELPDRDDQTRELLVARCEALLAAGDMASAANAVAQLQQATLDSPRLAAWAACFDGQLSMLIHPERLDTVETAVGAAADKLAELGDAAGEAKAHTVRAGCLARLGRIGDSEIALDHALTAARRAREHRRVNAVLAGAPLAALWGPNPVPRAGGRCLDVVRLLRITTDSPAVEATSTRCQAVLEAFRGRAAAARRMIDSARRTVAELGLRHSLLEVEQFAGIVELVIDDPAAAEPHLRKAYNGFRRMGLDADTAETAAILGRACLALDRDAEADELCTESERLAGHALKASIAWRTLRAQLLSRRGDHDEARRTAEAAVNLAERTDALVDHGDACLTLATVLEAAGDAAGARGAAARATDLYEQKGAAALAERARNVLGIDRDADSPAPAPEVSGMNLVNECIQVGERLVAAVNREAWDEVEHLLAPELSVEVRRKIVGLSAIRVSANQWPQEMKRYFKAGMVRFRYEVVAIRGERLALVRLAAAAADPSPGAPQDELLQVFGLDDAGLIALQVSFDVEDFDAAIAELDAMHARFAEELPRPPLANVATGTLDRFIALYADSRWDEIGAVFAADFRGDDRRRGLRRESNGRAVAVAEVRAIADLGVARITATPVALRGDNLCLSHEQFEGRGPKPGAFVTESLTITLVDSDGIVVTRIAFDVDDRDAAFDELDARYLAGEAAAHARTWSVLTDGHAAVNRHELPPTTPDCVSIDHRRGAAFAPGEMVSYLRASWDFDEEIRTYVESVHRLTDSGAVYTHAGQGISRDGFDAEWRGVSLLMVDGDLVSRCEIFDEADVAVALAVFEELHPRERRPENAASRLHQRYLAHFSTRDWDSMAGMLCENVFSDDRRHVVSDGARRGRDAEMRNVRAIAELGGESISPSVIATRGEHLVLLHVYLSIVDSPEPIAAAIDVVEISPDNQLAAHVLFDVDDIDAAFAEIDARYLAGEGSVHAHTWTVVTNAYAVLNRHEIPEISPGFVDIDHRKLAAIGSGDLAAYIRAALEDLTPQTTVYVEAVHRVSNLGAVVTHVARGVSHDGVDAEWRMIGLYMVAGDHISRIEIFDEADLDAALARFGELHPRERRLENAATRWHERFLPHFAARDWVAMAEMLSDDICLDDRRRVINAGVVRGRDVEIANLRAIAEAGVESMTSTAVALRGEHLLLHRVSFCVPNWSEDVNHEVIEVVEITTDNRGSAHVVFDPDDIDAAFEELDTRYLAGEAAAYAETWSLIAMTFASLNKRELDGVPAIRPDYQIIDHRLVHETVPAADVMALFRSTYDVTPDLYMYIEAVHLLDDFGAVITQTAYGTSQQCFEAQWRMLQVLTVEGDLGKECELFDEADLAAALARFEELHTRVRRLENAASRTYDRLKASFAARDWDALREIIAHDIRTDDRRRVVNAGIRTGRDAALAEASGFAEFGAKAIRSNVIATRGDRLILNRSELSARDPRLDEFDTEILDIIEIDVDERVIARLVFDADDIDDAFEELESRYVRGEAAAYAHTWSVLTGSYGSINRHEDPPTAAGWVNLDHRRATSFAPGELFAFLHAAWDLSPEERYHIETVHRLTDYGAVVTHAASGASRGGFDAEWRIAVLFAIDGDLIDRFEAFDEDDIDTAIARFDELSRPPQRLPNLASRVVERVRASLAARDWGAMAEILAANASNEDRRRVVNAEIRLGRDSVLEDLQASVEVMGITYLSSSVIATRGEHLVLIRARLGNSDRPEELLFDVLQVIAIDHEERLAAVVTFDLGDINAALEELDARYAAGEAAEHAHVWSVIAEGYAALNRHELAPIASDWVNADHRRGVAFADGDLVPYLRAGNLTTDSRIYVEAVIRLSNRGATVRHVIEGTSAEGFDAEWRQIAVVGVDGSSLNRLELFDEVDLDTALARFDELSQPTVRLENVASRIAERFQMHFAARDWDAIAEAFASDYYYDDRRRIVNAGVLHGRDAAVEDLHVAAEVGLLTNITLEFIATRGESHVLMRLRASGPDDPAVQLDVIQVAETNADERIAAAIVFDHDDIDAAYAELDARYLAGEAAPHADTWSVITKVCAALNRRQLPETKPDWVNLDHRRGGSFAPGLLTANIRATWDQTPDIGFQIAAVHRLTDSGAVVTGAANGTSQEGFGAEWRQIDLLMVEGGKLSRCEIFDEGDLDVALARFDELHSQPTRLENAASRVGARFSAYMAAPDWEAMAEMVAEDMCNDDRRPMINAGLRRGRDAEMANVRALVEIGVRNTSPVVIATRGERLALSRFQLSGRDRRPEAFKTDLLGMIEIDANGRIAARTWFDPKQIDDAYGELDARFLAGEAAPHPKIWGEITQSYAAMNRHEIPTTMSDWATIDHRVRETFEGNDLTAYTRSAWDLMPDVKIRIETVHRLSDLGLVATHVAHGTSEDGVAAEWRMIVLLVAQVAGANRCELFNEADLDAALTRFEELSRPMPRLDSPATGIAQRLSDAYNRRDSDGFLSLAAADGSFSDRRQGLHSVLERAGLRKNLQAILDVSPSGWRMTLEPIAIRGSRVSLTSARWVDVEDVDQPTTVEAWVVMEVSDDGLLCDSVTFDHDDLNGAYGELDARYRDGEASSHSHTWSVIAAAYDTLNSGEIPAATPDCVTIDSRGGGIAYEGNVDSYLNATWDIAPDATMRIETVHRLTDLGAVVTFTSSGTSQDGFSADWRGLNMLTVEGDLISRGEIFDEADLDAALAKFEELNR